MGAVDTVIRKLIGPLLHLLITHRTIVRLSPFNLIIKKGPLRPNILPVKQVALCFTLVWSVIHFCSTLFPIEALVVEGDDLSQRNLVVLVSRMGTD